MDAIVCVHDVHKCQRLHLPTVVEHQDYAEQCNDNQMMDYHCKNHFDDKPSMISIIKLHSKHTQILVNVLHRSEKVGLAASLFEIVNFQQTGDNECDVCVAWKKVVENFRFENVGHQDCLPVDAIQQQIECDVTEDHEIVERRHENVEIVAMREQTKA